MSDADTSRISPTAHYTGYVWFRNGMSHPALETSEGKLFYNSLRGFNFAARFITGGMTLERMLLQRHRIIDHILRSGIESGEIEQVVEIATGMSPRGWSFMRDYADSGLVYVEGDLPGMAERKRRTLEREGLRRPGHHVLDINALLESGPQSLFEAAGSVLDATKPTAIITEGLLNYFDRPSVVAMWDRFARFLTQFPRGTYLSDLSVIDETNAYFTARVFRRALSVFAKGEVHLHFETADEAERILTRAGFAEGRLILPREMRSMVDIPITRRPSPVRIVHALI